MPTPLIVRLAELSDAGIVGDLLHALDAHYLGAAEAPPAALAHDLARRVMAEVEGTRFAIAEEADPGGAGTRPVGLACFALVRSGRRLGGVLWLKDLFVIEPARGRGVGGALLAFLAREARARGIVRLDLATDSADARRLYERLGARAVPKTLLRFDEGAIARLADHP